jgi:hypothetical protein
MGKDNSHLDDSPQKAANQNNQISDDPRDGHRLTDNPERGGETALERRPEQDRQDRELVEEFGRRGVATTDKEA